MKSIKTSLFMLLISITAFAAHQQIKSLEKALQRAGKNRYELQKVLDHYRTDSLKYQAACFLIKNMDIHYSRTYYWADESNKKIPFDELNYNDFISSTIALDELKKNVKGLHAVPITIPDIEVMKSNYLINNIDNAFLAWDKKRVNKLSFSDFCEYILPYRANIEPLQSWRDKYVNGYAWIDDSLKLGKTNDPLIYFTKDISLNFKNTYNIETRQDPLPRLGALQLLHRRKGPCEDFADLAVFALRSQGFPAAVDYIPFWATSSGSHFINSTINSENRWVAFESFYGGTIDIKRLAREPSKVIRFTYSKQPGVIAEKELQSNIPNNFMRNYNYVDVSSDYWDTKDITCSLFPLNVKPQTAYACVLNYQNWQPTWWGKIKGDSATFSNMPEGVVYLPTYYQNNKLTPAGYPVALGFNHQLVLNPDTINIRRIKILQQEKYLKFRPNKRYKLLYWDKEWRLICERTTSENTLELIFDNVPTNALLILIPEYSERKERPFIITEEGKRIWF